MTRYLGLALALNHFRMSEMNSATQNYPRCLNCWFSLPGIEVCILQTTCTTFHKSNMIHTNIFCCENDFISWKMCWEDSKKSTYGIPAGKNAKRLGNSKKICVGRVEFGGIFSLFPDGIFPFLDHQLIDQLLLHRIMASNGAPSCSFSVKTGLKKHFNLDYHFKE